MKRTKDYSDIERFFASKAFAVIGVSSNQRKFGNVVYRTMREKGFTVYPVHPTRTTVEGDACFKDVTALPSEVGSIITVVPPAQTEKVTREALATSIGALWMQPGSESAEAVAAAASAERTVIHGQCILMFLEPVTSVHALHRWITKLLGAYPT